MAGGRRGWLPWIAAAIIVLAIAALARRPDESARSPSSPAHPSSVAPAQPGPASPGRVAPRSPVSATPRPALPENRAPSAPPPQTGPRVPATSIPTELPDSPSLARKLSRDGAVPDYREVYTYQLGLMAFTEQCMAGRVAKGIIYYYIHWEVDDEHLGTSPRVEIAEGVPPEGQVTSDDQQALVACVKQYVATHDEVQLPHAANGEVAWGQRAVFPLSDSLLLQWIVEARPELGAASGGSGER